MKATLYSIAYYANEIKSIYHMQWMDLKVHTNTLKQNFYMRRKQADTHNNPLYITRLNHNFGPFNIQIGHICPLKYNILFWSL